MSGETDVAVKWRAYLSGAQVASLPSALVSDNFERHTNNGSFSTTTTLKVDQPVFDVILAAAWSLVISTHSLLDDFVFGLLLPDSTHGTCPFRARIPGWKCTTLELVTNIDSSLSEIQSLQRGSISFKEIAQGDETCQAALKYCTALHILANESSGNVPESQPNELSYPIIISCVNSSDYLTITLDADTNVYTAGVCRYLLEHFCAAVTILSSNKSIPLNEINLMSDSECSQIQNWTAFPEPAAMQPFLHKLVENQAALTPLSVAIGQTEDVMTYRELNQGSNALANHIIRILESQKGGVGNVAIFFSKSAFAVLAMFAVLKAGGAFVPIDIHSPQKRIEKIVKNADITAILCSEDEKAKLKSFTSIPVVSVTARSIYNLKKETKQISPPEMTSLQPESPAYIMHSSGSTGVPKGIAISHLAITTCMNAMTRHFNTTESTRTLQFNALTFDVSVFDIWITLANGGRLCMPTEDERFSLNEFIVAERCNFAHITPSVAGFIDPVIAKRHLRMLATIGEAVKPEFLRRLAPEKVEDGEMILIDTWGPTEASVVGTASGPTTFNGKILNRRAGNIGYPVGCGIFIVSAENPNLLCPAYAPGEIAVVGPTLANGYWGDEAKTKEAFRTDLKWTQDRRWREFFGEPAMARVYLTGDIGRFSEEGDGSVIFMYRRGGYVKVNGLRIDPGEVETAVAEVGSNLPASEKSTSPCWEKNAVCVLEREVNGSEQQMLVCFIADSKEGATPGMGCEKLPMSKEKRLLFKCVTSGLRDVIPEYMVPSLFVSVAKMPFSTSDKLDRKTLVQLLDGVEWSDIAAEYAVAGAAAKV